MPKLSALAATSIAAVALAVVPAVASAEEIDVVARNLDQPRGLAFAPDGALWVTEAGRGGDGTCIPVGPAEGCFGTTGAITQVDVRRGTQQRVVDGLPSLAPKDPSGPAGLASTGVSDVAFGPLGRPFVVHGLHSESANRDLLEAGSERLGTLERFTFRGLRPVADLNAFEAANNPDGSAKESNPVSVSADAAGRRVVVDASANSLLEVDRDGETRVLAVFPETTVPFGPGTIQSQSVPTSVDRGPDGAWYVGELTGFPFPAGGADVYRVPRHGGAPQKIHTGFGFIIDVGFGGRGELYVLQLDDGTQTGASKLVRIGRFGDRSEVAAGRLNGATGLTVGADGAVYVANRGLEPGTGEVVRIRP